MARKINRGSRDDWGYGGEPDYPSPDPWPPKLDGLGKKKKKSKPGPGEGDLGGTPEGVAPPPPEVPGPGAYLAKIEPPQAQNLPAVQPDLVEFAREALEGARSASTRGYYERDWEKFKAWCRKVGAAFLPADPQTVVLYLSHLVKDGVPARGHRKGKRGYSPASLDRARAAIRHYHGQGGLTSPTTHDLVKDVLRGLKREHGEPQEKAKPLMPEHLVAILSKIEARGPRLRFLRDRAVLLTAMAGALRRAEVVALRVKDCSLTPGAVLFHLRQQQGQRIADVKKGTKHRGAHEDVSVLYERDYVPLPAIDPERAIREWLEEAPAGPDGFLIRRIQDGEVKDQPISARKVDRLAKECAQLLGFDPSEYGGHSLRAGMATYLIYEAKWNVFRVRDYLRHKNVETLDGYVRRWDQLREEDK